LRMPATCHHSDPRLMELARTFVESDSTGQPKLFYVWGHSYEFNDRDNWHIIEDFAKKVGNRDEVWYATNIEVYDYVKAFDSLVYSYDSKMVFNPSSTDIYACFYGKDVLIPAGKTVSITN